MPRDRLDTEITQWTGDATLLSNIIMNSFEFLLNISTFRIRGAKPDDDKFIVDHDQNVTGSYIQIRRNITDKFTPIGRGSLAIYRPRPPAATSSSNLNEEAALEVALLTKINESSLLFDYFRSRITGEPISEEQLAAVYSSITPILPTTASAKTFLESVDPNSVLKKLDGSALLGAYVRSTIKGKDGEPIITLTPEELDAVFSFIKPIVPEGQSPIAFLESLPGTPREKHRTCLKKLLFLNVPEQNIYKEKFNRDGYVDNMLDCMLRIADLIRTPYEVLCLELSTEEAQAKIERRESRLPPVHLQLSTLMTSLKKNMESMIPLKKARDELAIAETMKITTYKQLDSLMNSCSMARQRYDMLGDFARKRTQLHGIFSEIGAKFGIDESDPQKLLLTIDGIVQRQDRALQQGALELESVQKALSDAQVREGSLEIQIADLRIKQEALALAKQASETRAEAAVQELEVAKQLFRDEHPLIEARINGVNDRSEKAERELLAANESLESQSTDIRGIQNELAISIGNERRLNLEVERLRSELARLEAENAALQTRAAEAEVFQAELERLVPEIAAVNARSDKAEAELLKASEASAQIQLRAASDEARIQELESKLVSQSRQQETTQDTLRQLQAKMERVEQQYSVVLATKESEISVLTEQLDPIAEEVMIDTAPAPQKQQYAAHKLDITLVEGAPTGGALAEALPPKTQIKPVSTMASPDSDQNQTSTAPAAIMSGSDLFTKTTDLQTIFNKIYLKIEQLEEKGRKNKASYENVSILAIQFKVELEAAFNKYKNTASSDEEKAYKVLQHECQIATKIVSDEFEKHRGALGSKNFFVKLASSLYLYLFKKEAKTESTQYLVDFKDKLKIAQDGTPEETKDPSAGRASP